MNSKKWIIQYLEVLLDIIVMFTSYLIANWYKFGFFRTGLINHTEHYLTLFLVELVAYVVVHFVAFADDNPEDVCICGCNHSRLCIFHKNK